MNILIAFPFLLHARVKHGGGQQILRLIKGLHQLGHQIHLLCLSEADPRLFQSDIDELALYCAEVKIFPRPKLHFYSKIVSFLKPSIPPHARNLIIPEAKEYVRSITSSGRVEVAYLVYTAMGEYARCVDRRKCCLLVDTIEIETRKYSMLMKANTTLARRLHAAITHFRTKRYEKKLLENVDAVVTISREETAFIQAFCSPNKIHIVPSLIDTKEYAPSKHPTDRNSLLFFGSFDHPPNVDSITWFCKEVFPLITKELPETTLYIVGANSMKKVGRLKNNNITVVDTVPDIREWIAKAAVIVSPIVSGGGSRIKNVETLAMGKALVTTSLGAEGLNDSRALGYFIADTAIDFAKKVVDLLKDAKLRTNIGDLGRKEIENKHDSLVNSIRLSQLLFELKTSAPCSNDLVCSVFHRENQLKKMPLLLL